MESLRAETASQQQQQQPPVQRSIPSEQPSAEHAQALSAAEAKLKDLQGALQKAEAAVEREQRLQQTVDELQRANAELDAALAQERERLTSLQADLAQASSEAESRLHDLEAEKRDLASSLQVGARQMLSVYAPFEMHKHCQAFTASPVSRSEVPTYSPADLKSCIRQSVFRASWILKTFSRCTTSGVPRMPPNVRLCLHPSPARYKRPCVTKVIEH